MKLFFLSPPLQPTAYLFHPTPLIPWNQWSLNMWSLWLKTASPLGKTGKAYAYGPATLHASKFNPIGPNIFYIFIHFKKSLRFNMSKHKTRNSISQATGSLTLFCFRASIAKFVILIIRNMMAHRLNICLKYWFFFSEALRFYSALSLQILRTSPD